VVSSRAETEWRVHVAYRKILLVGKYQEKSIAEFVFVQHPLQLITCLNHTISIIAIDDENDALGVLEVVTPEGSNLVLSTDIPDCKLDVLVFDRLDVET